MEKRELVADREYEKGTGGKMNEKRGKVVEDWKDVALVEGERCRE